MDNNKISTSIQYQISNIVLFNDVFVNWSNFNNKLKKGPEEIKQYLLEMWNNLIKSLKDRNDIIAKDKEKDVNINDFDVTYNKTKNETSIFFLTLPDYEYQDGASKYVAIALTPKMPRYFTLEYSKSFIDNSTCWYVGEFAIQNKQKVHHNYGKSDNMRLSWFAGYIVGLLESENL